MKWRSDLDAGECMEFPREVMVAVASTGSGKLNPIWRTMEDGSCEVIVGDVWVSRGQEWCDIEAHGQRDQEWSNLMTQTFGNEGSVDKGQGLVRSGENLVRMYGARQDPQGDLGWR